MGLFNFFSNELIEIITWEEREGGDLMLWKFPDKERDIKNGAQLTVTESQQAIFVNEGEIADIYGPGRHELRTENMPILTKLKGWVYGFNSPFKADVYFVSTRTFTDMKWGTQQPIMMRDPEFKMVRVQAFGVYFMKVSDPRKFFKEFAGTAPALTASVVEERMRSIVTSKFAEALAESQVSVMDMVANYTEIGDKILPSLQDDFAQFGITLTRFQIASTTLPPEVIAFYDKMTNMHMAGNNMQQYQQFTTINALEEAAKRGGGGIGTDIASGLTFSNLMMNHLNNNNQPPPVAPPVQSKEDIMNMLKQLGELKAAGILTEDEFNAKKTELLAKL